MAGSSNNRSLIVDAVEPIVVLPCFPNFRHHEKRPTVDNELAIVMRIDHVVADIDNLVGGKIGRLRPMQPVRTKGYPRSPPGCVGVAFPQRLAESTGRPVVASFRNRLINILNYEIGLVHIAKKLGEDQ